MADLHVTGIQSTIHWEQKTANLEWFGQQLDRLTHPTDLIILPEMFTTGFSMSPAPFAEDMTGPTMEWLARQASKANAVITGSFIAQEDGNYYNRLVWMRPDGSFEHYDKRHLFTLAGEQDHYTTGKKRLIVEIKGWKVMPLICYDLRFPVWSRNTDNYDLLVYTANWPHKRSAAWRSLLAARAIENQAYTVGLNRIGNDPNGNYYSGDSSIIDYAGETLALAVHQEQIISATLYKEKQEQFRSKLRFLQDQDHFTISI